jgi:hypothetical protein
MNDLHHRHAREQFNAAMRAMICSPADLQSRLVAAYAYIRQVTLDEFDNDTELKLKLARILDLLSTDTGDIDEEVVATAYSMTELEATKVAHLICDFCYELA